MTATRNSTKPELQESSEIQFLLREHDFTAQQWKEDNELTNQSIKAYLTIVGTLAASIAVLSQLVSSVTLLAVIMELAVLALFVPGLLLQSRLVTGYIVRAEYIERLHRIRQYFIERSKNLEAYLPYPPRFRSGKYYMGDVLRFLPSAWLTRIMILWNSSLFAAGTAFAAMFIATAFHVSPWVFPIVALMAWIVCHWLLQFSIQRRIFRYRTSLG